MHTRAPDVIAIFRKMRESNRTIKCQRDVAMLALLLDPKISLRKVSGLLYKGGSECEDACERMQKSYLPRGTF